MVYAKKMPQGAEEVVLGEVQFAKGSKERSRFGQELNTLRKFNVSFLDTQRFLKIILLIERWSFFVSETPIKL